MGYEYNGIELVQTCWACPEQYDAIKDGKTVGYLRLRHGHFYVECPDVGGEEVYSASPKGDGSFFDDERDFYLKSALKAIDGWLTGEEYLKHEVETPLGTLIAKISTDHDYPGIDIVLRKPEGYEINVALVEVPCYDNDSLQGKLVTRVWGEEDEEDYTHLIVHEFDESEV